MDKPEEPSAEGGASPEAPEPASSAASPNPAPAIASEAAEEEPRVDLGPPAGGLGGNPSAEGDKAAKAPVAQPRRSPWAFIKTQFERLSRGIREYFVVDEPSVSASILPLCVLSVVLYTRHPTETNFIFDEQEALLANPYVRSVMDAHPTLHWRDAFTTDFWGRAPEVTIGSYRPLPNLIWRAVWWVTCSLRTLAGGRGTDSPFLCHWVNVLLHGVNGALITAIAYRLTKRRDVAWLSGAVFVASAILTEAVSGVVGLSDVLGGMGALLALLALTLPAHLMPLGVFLGCIFGLFSKESALCCVPLVPLAALMTAQITHPVKPRRWLRAVLSFVAAFAAFVIYVQIRKKLFHTSTPAEFLPENVAGKGRGARFFAAVLRWYAQPGLPRDALNNPLVEADTAHRIAGALRVYARGLGQVLVPRSLSGDYSSPQEPAPKNLFFPESIIGGIAMLGPILAFPVAGIAAYRRWKTTSLAKAITAPDLRPVLAVLGVWVVISYFPVSNIPILLPTVRAERFWYFPVLATSILVAIAIVKGMDWAAKDGSRFTAAAMVTVWCFMGFQCYAARRHANDYRDDLTFWESTRRAVPNSSKAHLNYSVMLGARGRMEERLAANRRALELEPTWAMANIYLGDTLCRMHRAKEAIPHYEHGFDLGPNDVSLIALALQCLWDEKELAQTGELIDDLDTRATEHPGSWYEYLVRDIKENGEKNNGVDPKQRPRGYNEGPKD